MATKMPRSTFPMGRAVSYYRGINKLVQQNRKHMWQVFADDIKPLIHEYRIQRDSGLFVVDAGGILQRITELLQMAREWSASFVFTPNNIGELARGFVKSINAFSKDTFSKQVKAVQGIDPIGREPWLEDVLESSVKKNVSYIGSIDKSYHDRIQTIIIDGVQRGVSINEMAAQIKEASGAAEAKAKFIARDQSGSLLGNLTKARHEAAGIKKFIWRDSDDERVRDSHEAFDDNEFTWKDGAKIKRKGRTVSVWPGTDYNCRCTADPVIE